MIAWLVSEQPGGSHAAILEELSRCLLDGRVPELYVVREVLEVALTAAVASVTERDDLEANHGHR